MEGVGHTGRVPGAHRGKSSAQRPAGFRGSRPSSPWGGAASLCVSAPRLYSRLYCRQGLAAFPRARLTAGLHARCSLGWNGPRPRA